MDDKAFEWMKLEYEHNHNNDREMFQSVMEASSAALKSSFLMNGAATIALLTLVGSTVSNPPKEFPDFFSNTSHAAFLFSMGVLFTAIATGIKYLTQSLYATAKFKRYQPSYPYTKDDYQALLDSWKSGGKYRKWGNFLNFFSISFAAMGYIFFMAGVFKFGSTFGLTICSLL